MSKKFKAINMKKLDSPMRRKIMPPEKVVSMLDIKKEQHIGDVGCGIGYFTIPIAKQIDHTGKVYAIDINELMLEETKKRIEEQGIQNVQIVQSSENSFNIQEKALDIVFTSTVFHEVNQPQKFLEECKRVLKKEGTLVILDWNKIQEEFGPPIDHRVDVEIVKEQLQLSGLKIDKIEYIGQSFYMVYAVNKELS